MCYIVSILANSKAVQAKLPHFLIKLRLSYLYGNSFTCETASLNWNDLQNIKAILLTQKEFNWIPLVAFLVDLFTPSSVKWSSYGWCIFAVGSTSNLPWGLREDLIQAGCPSPMGEGLPWNSNQKFLFKKKRIWKCHLWNGGHFVHGEMSWLTWFRCMIGLACNWFPQIY